VAHDYTGHSQFNPVHGGMKKAARWADDIFVHGHKHNTGMGIVIDPKTQKICHVIRMDSYKRFDDYPKKLGIDDTFMSPCVLTIINPYAKNARDKVIVSLSMRQGTEIFKDMRRRWKKESKK